MKPIIFWSLVAIVILPLVVLLMAVFGWWALAALVWLASLCTLLTEGYP